MAEEKVTLGVYDTDGNELSEESELYNLFDESIAIEDNATWKRVQVGWQIGLDYDMKRFNIGARYGIDFNRVQRHIHWNFLSLQIGVNF